MQCLGYSHQFDNIFIFSPASLDILYFIMYSIIKEKRFAIFFKLQEKRFAYFWTEHIKNNFSPSIGK